MKILILAGTSEARQLAAALHKGGHRVTLSYSGATSRPIPVPVATRSGGFGGVDGLAAYLRREKVGLLIDATHPFSLRMPQNAFSAARATGVPRLRLLREAWTNAPHWHRFGAVSEAVSALPTGARVLAVTGSGSLGELAARTDLDIRLRMIEEPDTLPDHITPIIDRPPYDPAEERRLLDGIRPTHLLIKNAGGPAGKIAAADAVGAAIFMVDRPAPVEGPVLTWVADALDWVAEMVAKHHHEA